MLVIHFQAKALSWLKTPDRKAEWACELRAHGTWLTFFTDLFPRIRKKKKNKEVQQEETLRNRKKINKHWRCKNNCVLQTALQILITVLSPKVIVKKPWKYRHQHGVMQVSVCKRVVDLSRQKAAINKVSVRPHSDCKHLSDLQKASKREGKWASELCVTATYILLAAELNQAERFCWAPPPACRTHTSSSHEAMKSHISPILLLAVIEVLVLV